MGHCISAIVIPGDVDPASAAVFDAKIVDSSDDFTLIALEDDYVDAWAERLGIAGAYAEFPLLNFRVVHHITNALAEGRPFAIIETDYFGGQGSQSAAVYHGATEVMAPTNAESNVINNALRLLGVPRRTGLDEFDTLGLGDYRNWDDLFDDYCDG